jgi:DNA-binding response OmpR family regulator
MEHDTEITRYDIILLDLRLEFREVAPSGQRILQDIRSKNADIPIIVMSGISELETLRKSFEIGATDYIIKPFRL